MESSRHLDHDIRTQNALWKSKILQWRTLDDIIANKGQISFLLTAVSLIAVWVDREFISLMRKRRKRNLCHKHFFPFLAAPSVAPELILMPGKTLSLQCIYLTYVEQGHCYTPLQQWVTLMWVDEVGAKIQEDSQHQIKRRYSCDITLTVILQSPENKKFRCRATVAGEVYTSVEMHVRVPGLNITEPNQSFVLNAKN